MVASPFSIPSDRSLETSLGLRHAIGWCDFTLQPGVYGCAMVSPACGTADGSSMCYASVTAERLIRFAEARGQVSPYAGTVDSGRWNGEVRTDEARIVLAFAGLPKRPRTDGRPWHVFVTSMADLFHVAVPFAFLDRVFAEMAARAHIAFQVLTKRADRMAEYARDRRRRGLAWPANVWAGTTVEDQRRARERVFHLLDVPAAVRFLSIEPMLGALDLDPATCPHCHEQVHLGVADDGATPWCNECDSEAAFGMWLDACASATQAGVNFAIIGSESNGTRPGKRLTDPEAAAALIDQLDRAGVPVFLKQLTIAGKLIDRPAYNGVQRLAFPIAA